MTAVAIATSGSISNTLLTHSRRPGERSVFIDEGKISPDSWTVFYDQESWWDLPTVRHGDGTNFSFADGHSDHWKWKDPRTVKLAEATGSQTIDSVQPGNTDLHAVQKAAWGNLGYEPGNLVDCSYYYPTLFISHRILNPI